MFCVIKCNFYDGLEKTCSGVLRNSHRRFKMKKILGSDFEELRGIILTNCITLWNVNLNLFDFKIVNENLDKNEDLVACRKNSYFLVLLGFCAVLSLGSQLFGIFSWMNIKTIVCNLK